MSASKVKKVKRVINFTATWATDVLTVTTAAVHDAIIGDTVLLKFQNSPQEFRAVVASIPTTSQMTFAAVGANNAFITSGEAEFDFVRTAGGNFIIAAPSTGGNGSIIQATVSGTNGSTVGVYGSLDGLNFTTAVLGTLTNTVGQTVFLSIPNNWAYLKLNPSAIGAATKLQLWYAA